MTRTMTLKRICDGVMGACVYFLYGENPLLFLDSSDGCICEFEKLSALTGGKTVSVPETVFPHVEFLSRSLRVSEGELLLQHWSFCDFCYVPERKSFRFLLNPERKKLSARTLVHLWRWAVFSVFYSGVLRGESIMPFHGAALKNEHGLLLLCGQSGMGKSTTADRWKTSGGEVLCDDLMLLEEIPGGIVAHPLPTWSRCLNSIEGEEVNFTETCPIQAVFALKRSMTGEEKLEKTEKNIYYSSIYSACCFFLLPIIKKMPEAEQKQLRLAAISWADKLSVGENLALYADSHGDLKKTLKDCQKTDSSLVSLVG